MRMAAQRFLNDIKRKDMFFSYREVDRCISFFATLRHSTGRFSKKPFHLMPWQQFIIANIIGFRWKDTGRRRFTQSYIEMARKQGKTALMAGLALYYMIADGEDGAECDLAANSRDQAKIAFRMAKQFCRCLDPTGKTVRPLQYTIEVVPTDGIMNVFASDDSRLDGYNASFAIIDEYHSAPNDLVRNVIKSSMGMRDNPHLVTITTAGFDKTLPCYELRNVAADVLAGVKRDDSMFAAIYELDEEDDWRDEKVWPKCSPNLGVTVSLEFLRTEVRAAINNPREEVSVKTKNLNIWCDAQSVWIPEEDIRAITAPVIWDNFDPDEDICFVGVDLSAVSDLTAVAYLIQHDQTLYIYIDYYLPAEALETKKDRDKYAMWRAAGELNVTPGNVTDYDYITQDIIRRNKSVQIMKIGYDKWNATQWAIDCTALGMPLEEYPQSLASFTGPTKELERIILRAANQMKTTKGKLDDEDAPEIRPSLIIDNNSINRFCFRNVVLKSDWNGNVKPVKDATKNKIDGVVAILEALGCYMNNPLYTGSILSTSADYED